MKYFKLHVRHADPGIMSISHIHVLLLSSAIISPALPSWSPVLVLKLPIARNRPRSPCVHLWNCCTQCCTQRVLLQQHCKQQLHRIAASRNIHAMLWRIPNWNWPIRAPVHLCLTGLVTVPYDVIVACSVAACVHATGNELHAILHETLSHRVSAPVW